MIDKAGGHSGQSKSDNLYGWLRVVFAYATGKPFVYYSRYVPSARVFQLAREHDVRLVWSPLHRIPAALLERHRTWRQLWLSESQWERAHRADGDGQDRPSDSRP